MPEHAGDAGAAHQRWQHLRTYLTADTTLPLPARAAATIALLYGAPLTRVLQMRTADIVTLASADVATCGWASIRSCYRQPWPAWSAGKPPKPAPGRSPWTGAGGCSRAAPRSAQIGTYTSLPPARVPFASRLCRDIVPTVSALQDILNTHLVDTADLARILGATTRSINRWYANGNGPTRREHIQRMLELRAVLNLTAQAMPPEPAAMWLRSPIPELGYDKPLDLVRDGKFRRVINCLTVITERTPK